MLITCVITGTWHAADDVSSHWGTGQDKRQRREPQSIGGDTSLARLHGHTTPLIPSDLLLLSNPASPPYTPIFPAGVHIPCQISGVGGHSSITHRALPSSLSLRRLPGALGLGRMISQGVRGELK